MGKRPIFEIQKKRRPKNKMRHKKTNLKIQPIIFDATVGHCTRTLPYNTFPGIKYSTRLPNGLRVHLPQREGLNYMASEDLHLLATIEKHDEKLESNDSGYNNDVIIEVSAVSPKVWEQNVENDLVSPKETELRLRPKDNDKLESFHDENNNINRSFDTLDETTSKKYGLQCPETINPSNGAGDSTMISDTVLRKTHLSDQTKVIIDMPREYIQYAKDQSGNENYSCTSCSKSFHQMWYLQRHWLQVHSACYLKE